MTWKPRNTPTTTLLTFHNAHGREVSLESCANYSLAITYTSGTVEDKYRLALGAGTASHVAQASANNMRVAATYIGCH